MTNIREKLDLVGKLETLQSMLDENHSSNGIIKKYVAAYKFRSDIDTMTLTSNMLREFKVYDWMSSINEFCEVIKTDLNESKIDLALESTLFRVTFDNRHNSYNGTITILEGLIADENLDNDKILVALKESTWIPAIKNLFALVESSSSIAVTTDPSVNVTKVYTPIDTINEGEENESYLFNMNGRLYEMCGNEMLASTVKPSPLFSKLLSVCEAFDICDDKLKLTHKAHTIEIMLGESTEFTLDGKVVEAENINSTLAATGSFHVNEMAKLDLITFAAANADKIVEMDCATSINSKVYEGVVTNIIKLDENVFVNTINPSMMSNTLTKAENANNAVEMVKEFVNYDPSNFVKDLLIGEAKFAAEINESKTLIEERITFLNEQLGDIYAAEKEIGENSDLNKAKEIINESLITEKATLSKLLAK